MKILKPQQYKAILREKYFLDTRASQPRYLHCQLDLCTDIAPVYYAGQYCNILLNDGKRRSYSLSSVANETASIEICVELLDSGKCSSYLRLASVGDMIDLILPYGRFVLPSEPVHAIVMVATGSGIVPCISMIRSLSFHNSSTPTTPVHLLWGMRHDEHLFWHEELESLQKTTSWFTFSTCVTQPSDLYTASDIASHQIGRVTKYLRQYCTPETLLYVCGGKQMISDVHNHAITLGLDSANIIVEQFHSL